jgi:hypothetical protein
VRIGLLLMALAGLVAFPAPARAQDNLVLRLVVHQPGIVRLDGREFLDLSRSSEHAPDPWREFVMRYIPVEPGHHELSLRPDDPLAVPPFESVAVEGGAGDTVGVVLGRPRISTSPPGARVLVNGNPQGNTPLSINPADLIKTEVTIELKHYRTETLTGDSILAVARDGGAFRLELKPVDLEKGVLPPLGEPESYWDRNRTLALTGSVALLTAGIYAGLRFKDQADEKYDEYRRTGNRERQKDLFNQAERFDRLSLFGWGVGEVAFLATFFLIIHEQPRGLVPTARLDKDQGDGATRLQLGLSHDF